MHFVMDCTERVHYCACTIRYSTVLCSSLLYSSIPYSTVLCSTAQYMTWPITLFLTLQVLEEFCLDKSEELLMRYVRDKKYTILSATFNVHVNFYCT